MTDDRQVDLLDAIEGARQKDLGMQRAEDGAGPEWADLAAAAVLTVASSKATFTSDDVWATGLVKPKEPRALGAVMSRLARRHVIEATGRFVKTAQVARHNAPVAEWRKR